YTSPESMTCWPIALTLGLNRARKSQIEAVPVRTARRRSGHSERPFYSELSILTDPRRGAGMKYCAAFLIGRHGPGRVPLPPIPQARGRDHCFRLLQGTRMRPRRVLIPLAIDKLGSTKWHDPRWLGPAVAIVALAIIAIWFWRHWSP